MNINIKSHSIQNNIQITLQHHKRFSWSYYNIMSPTGVLIPEIRSWVMVNDKQMIKIQEEHDGCLIQSRNCLPFLCLDFVTGVSRVSVARYLLFCVVFNRSLFVHLSFFLLAITLSVLLQITTSDYSFWYFQPFLTRL